MSSGGLTWGDIYNLGLTWGDVYDLNITWGELYEMSPDELRRLAYEKLVEYKEVSKKGNIDEKASKVLSHVYKENESILSKIMSFPKEWSQPLLEKMFDFLLEIVRDPTKLIQIIIVIKYLFNQLSD